MAVNTAGDEIMFFIPDLGGFTKFIAETEIQHSQHIIQELLEILADANTLGMQVSEFEGDAVLFYRNGAPPSLQQLVQQANDNGGRDNVSVILVRVNRNYPARTGWFAKLKSWFG